MDTSLSLSLMPIAGQRGNRASERDEAGWHAGADNGKLQKMPIWGLAPQPMWRKARHREHTENNISSLYDGGLYILLSQLECSWNNILWVTDLFATHYPAMHTWSWSVISATEKQNVKCRKMRATLWAKKILMSRESAFRNVNAFESHTAISGKEENNVAFSWSFAAIRLTGYFTIIYQVSSDLLTSHQLITCCNH